MPPLRILGLLVILLAVQGLCKPNKSADNADDDDYEDDTPVDEDEEEEEEEDGIGNNDAPPQIVSKGQSIRVKAGTTVVLPCQVINTENNVVGWMKDDAYLYVEAQAHTNDSKRIVRLPDNSLEIHNASVNDSSNNYKCIIFREPDNIYLIHRLLVDPDRPSQYSHKGMIRVTPSRRIEVNEGQRITFGCETDILPPPEIKWFAANKKVDTYNPNVVLNGNFITIKKVNKSHSALYQCLAEDGSKTPAMEAITLVVHYIPEIEVKRGTVHSGVGVESEMTCIVSANPDAIITWHKDNKEIIYKKGSIMFQHGYLKNNKTKHVLKILHTSQHDFGEYKCHAQNSIGESARFIKLVGTPSQAKIFGVEMTDDDMGIILRWRLESYSPISEYKLQFRHIDDKNWKTVHPEVKDGKGNQFLVEYVIRDLQPGSYEAIVVARNEFGWSPPSEPHIFTGDYPPEMAQKDGNAAAYIRSSGIISLILVLLSCAFTSL